MTKTRGPDGQYTLAFTPRDKLFMQKMRAWGWSYRAIAKEFQSSFVTVRSITQDVKVKKVPRCYFCKTILTQDYQKLEINEKAQCFCEPHALWIKSLTAN